MSGERIGRADYLIAVAIAVSLFYCLALVVDLPIVSDFIKEVLSARMKPAPGLWLLAPLALILTFVVRLIFRSSLRLSRKIALIVLTGYLIQVVFFSAGWQGFTERRSSWMRSGQVTFLEPVGSSIARMAKHYEEIVIFSEEMDPLHVTKPPGTVLFYMAFGEGVRQISGILPESSIEHRIIHAGSFLFPLIAVLAAVPLILLCRNLGNTEIGLAASLMLISSPYFVLIFAHADKFLYPLIGLSAIYLATLSIRMKSILMAVLAGIMTQITLFFSFSLIPIAILVFFLLSTACSPFRNGIPRDKGLSVNSMKYLAFGLIGFTICYILFRVILGYDALKHFITAIGRHSQWKYECLGFTWNPGNVILFAGRNFAEFGFAIGAGLLLLSAAGCIKAGRDLLRKQSSRIAIFSILVAFLLLVTGFLGRTAGEVSRLWIFFLPLLCIPAAYLITGSVSGKRLSLRVTIVVLFQLFTTAFIKHFQDFF